MDTQLRIREEEWCKQTLSQAMKGLGYLPTELGWPGGGVSDLDGQRGRRSPARVHRGGQRWSPEVDSPNLQLSPAISTRTTAGLLGWSSQLPGKIFCNWSLHQPGPSTCKVLAVLLHRGALACLEFTLLHTSLWRKPTSPPKVEEEEEEEGEGGGGGGRAVPIIHQLLVWKPDLVSSDPALFSHMPIAHPWKELRPENHSKMHRKMILSRRWARVGFSASSCQKLRSFVEFSFLHSHAAKLFAGQKLASC